MSALAQGATDDLFEFLIDPGFGDDLLSIPFGQCLDDVFLLCISGQENSDHARMAPSDFTRQLDAVHARHKNVGNQQIARFLRKNIQCFVRTGKKTTMPGFVLQQ